MHLFRNGSYIGLDPITNKSVNLSLVCEAELLKKIDSPKALLNYFISSSTSLSKSVGLLGENEEVFCVSPICHRVTSAVSDQSALVGDAAGFIDPLTGEGIFNALWTSSVLAQEIITKGQGPFNCELALNAYEKKRVSFFRQKVLLNKFFQWLIYQESLVELVARFLRTKKSRGDSFVGIIGNIYKPLNGFLKILK